MKDIMLFFKDDAGATAAEYSIMVALIAVVIIGSVVFFGEQVNNLFVQAREEMTKHGI